MVCVRIISSNIALVSCSDFLFAVQTTSPALAPNPNPNAMPSVSAQDSVPPINCPFKPQTTCALATRWCASRSKVNHSPTTLHLFTACTYNILKLDTQRRFTKSQWLRKATSVIYDACLRPEVLNLSLHVKKLETVEKDTESTEKAQHNGGLLYSRPVGALGGLLL